MRGKNEVEEVMNNPKYYSYQDYIIQERDNKQEERKPLTKEKFDSLNKNDLIKITKGHYLELVNNQRNNYKPRKKISIHGLLEALGFLTLIFWTIDILSKLL